jgi:hypothetical protein
LIVSLFVCCLLLSCSSHGVVDYCASGVVVDRGLEALRAAVFNSHENEQVLPNAVVVSLLLPGANEAEPDGVGEAGAEEYDLIYSVMRVVRLFSASLASLPYMPLAAYL